MNKTILGTGVLFGLLAVLLGAFGAHGLKGMIPEEALNAYNTGVEYQMYHALLLLIIGGMEGLDNRSKTWIFRFLITGILCFSFSLYVLALKSLIGFEAGALVALTPIGGLFLVSGWILLAYRVFKPLN